MRDWIWYHIWIGKNLQHKSMRSIYWREKRNKPIGIAYALAVHNVARFHKCRSRWQ